VRVAYVCEWLQRIGIGDVVGALRKSKAKML